MMGAMQLDIESLRTLVTVLDRGGMTRAAETLGLSQSSVSWKIKRLEQKVGRPLLIRDGHTLLPSRDGRALIDDAREIIAIHDRAVARLQTSDLTGVVRIGANEEIGAERVADVLGRFRREHPGTTVEFRIAPTEQLADDVDAGAIDVAVIQVVDEDLRPTDQILWTDQLRWASCCGSPYDDGPVPLVTFGEQCYYRSLSEPLLAAHGVEYAVTLSVGTATGVRSAIAAGLGIGVLGERHFGNDVVEWPRGRELDALPRVHQIARTVPGEIRGVAAAISEVLVAELRERPVAV
jgi:DNA-binding transcriptional LysR family regulator